jgi:hypothetical protein
MRETFFKDDNEFKQGVPSLSGMIFLEGFSLEMVAVPVHIPERMPEKGSYWYINLDNYQIPILFDKPEHLAPNAINQAFGTRLTTTLFSTDMSFSLYHGPDSSLLFLPDSTRIEQGQPVSVLVKPKAYVVNKIGMDFSRAIGKIVLQFEGAYTLDKRGTVEQHITNPAQVVFPYDVKKSGHMAFSAGFNYFIPLNAILKDHEGDTVLTMEWFQSEYVDKTLSSPLLTDLVIARIEDSYFGNRLAISLAGILYTKKHGYVVWPKVGYNFQNGFSTDLSYVHINGKSDSVNTTESLFYYLRNNDTLIWKLKYDF